MKMDNWNFNQSPIFFCTEVVPCVLEICHMFPMVVHTTSPFYVVLKWFQVLQLSVSLTKFWSWGHGLFQPWNFHNFQNIIVPHKGRGGVGVPAACIYFTNIHDLTFVFRTRMPLHLASEQNQQPKTQPSITSFGSLHNQWVIGQRVLNLLVCNWSASKVKSQHPWCKSHSLHALLIINDLAHKAQLVKRNANFKILKLQLKKRKASLLYPIHYYGPSSYLNTTYFWTKCSWCKRLEHIGILKPEAY